MSQQYRILLVEDSPDDAEIIRYTMTKAGIAFTMTVVETERQFSDALRGSRPDLVLSDYHLPQFSGKEALRLLLDFDGTIPFILVSGAVGDELAVEMLTTGCVDYILKDKLTRLPSAIRRAVQEAQNEQERRRTVEELKESELRFRRIADQSPMFIWMTDVKGNTTYVNRSWSVFTGRSLEQEAGKGWEEGLHPDDRERCSAVYAVASARREPVTIEYRLRNHAGEYRWLLDTGVPNFLPNGEFVGFIGSCIDIQDRKESELAVMQSEEKFRRMFNSAPAKLLIDPESGAIVDVNAAGCQFYGWSAEEMKRMSIGDINIHGVAGLQQKLGAAFEGHVKDFTAIHRRKDGSLRNVDIYPTVVEVSGRPFIYEFVMDVTDKLRSEERLRIVNAALDSAENAIVISDTDGSIMWSNPSFLRLTGYTMPEVLGRNLRDLVRTEHQPKEFFAEMWKTIKNGRVWKGELINRRKDGTEYTEEQTITPVTNTQGVVTHFISIKQDITDRRTMVENLRRTTELLDTFFTQSLDACYFMQFRTPFRWDSTVDKEALLDDVFETASIWKLNDALLKQYRIPKEIVLGMNPRAMFNGDEEKLRKLFTQLFDAGATFYSTTMLRNDDKSEIVVEGNAVCMFDMDGRIVGFFGIQRDVTESVKEREELRLNQDRYKRFFESDMTGDFITRPDGTLVICNQSFARIFGYTGIDEALTVNVQHLYSDQNERLELFEHLARDGKVENLMLHGRRRNGDEFIALMTAMAHRNAAGDIVEVVGFIIDDTRRQEVESQMIQAQKMESIGELASGVAHDFNNILNNILGFSQQLVKYHMDPTRVLRYSDTIGKSAQRGTDIAAKLLSFARQRKTEIAVLSITDLMGDVVQMCRDTFMHSIEVRTDVASDLWRVQGERSGLYQMLLNIAMNARDALLELDMPTEVPTLTFIAVNGRTPEPHLHWFRNTPPSQFVEIIIRDNGPGISQQNIDKIFDPFFSTKKMSDKKGSGLGLTVVYNIVKNHHGAIQVRSDEGKGTAFHLYLPAVEYASNEAAKVDAASYQSRSNELILVVDDDEGMQVLAQELLEDNGYRVLIASNGFAAIALLEKHKHDVALIILDLVMPGMDGGQTYLRMKQIKPDLNACFCTGFVTDALISNLLAEEHLTAIQKPFKSDQFLKFVHGMLNKQ